MTYKLKDLILKSGDSELESYCYIKGVLNVGVEFSELDVLVKLSIPTQTIFGTEVFSKDSVSQTCYMELIDLQDVLQVSNGRYLPANDFSKLMQHERECISLAYCKSVKSVRYLLRFKGASVLLACLINSPEDVSIEIEK